MNPDSLLFVVVKTSTSLEELSVIFDFSVDVRPTVGIEVTTAVLVSVWSVVVVVVVELDPAEVYVAASVVSVDSVSFFAIVDVIDELLSSVVDIKSSVGLLCSAAVPAFPVTDVAGTL